MGGTVHGPLWGKLLAAAGNAKGYHEPPSRIRRAHAKT